MFLEHPDYDQHELVSFHADRHSGLKAFIAIHNSNLGPAIGGCRMLPYASSADAVTDVLRLSRGMTYKCAIAGIPYGGGKAVIIADPEIEKTTALLHAMGDFVNSLQGKYITSFDSGTTLSDVEIMGERTAFVGGIKAGAGNASASTARGIFICIEKAVNAWLNMDSLAGARVAVQGAGNVGARLTRLLVDAGAEVSLADVNLSRAQLVAAETGAKLVDPKYIHALDVDVFAPCAMGGIISQNTLREVRARVIAGGANNQLAEPHYARDLSDLGILYCPDYLVNAGGIIDLHYQRSNGSRDALHRHLYFLGDTLLDIISGAKRTGQTPIEVANEIVHQRLAGGNINNVWS